MPCTIRTIVKRTIINVGGVLLLSSTAGAQDAQLLTRAVRHGDTTAVRSLIAKRIDVNVAQPDGTTALHWAAHQNNLELADLLLKGGATPNVVTEFGVTPLSLAATNGSTAIIQRLLAAGADVNRASPTGETPLMTAARSGHLDAVACLLAAGANPNLAEQVLGQTALMWAASEQHADVVNALLNAKADVGAASRAGFTPLMFAAREGDVEISRSLLDAGAAIDAVSTAGDTALLVAVVRGHVDLAKFLLDHKANANVDKAGYAALHWAAGRWETGMTRDYPEAQGEWATLGGVPSSRRLELVSALLSHGADANAVAKKSPPRFGINLFYGVVSGVTPFWLAAMSADVDVMRLLVAHGANPDVTSADGATPLMTACGAGRVEGESWITDEQSRAAVALLLEWRPDNVNAVNRSGDTALHAAAVQGLDETVRYLAAHGADLQIKNKKGQTALAAAEGTTILAQLIEHPRTAEVIRTLGGTK